MDFHFLLPRERLLQQGSTALSDAELLALILGSGPRATDQTNPSVLRLAELLMAEYGSLPCLFAAPEESLGKIRGIGPAKIAILRATLEIARRLPRRSVGGAVSVGSSQDAYRWFSPLALETQEVLWALFLNAQNEVIREKEMFRGTATGCQARPREILREALRQDAVRMVVAHNHPSGKLVPSDEDRRFTRALREAAVNLSIPLLDHLIVGPGQAEFNYFSFADEDHALGKPWSHGL